MLSDSTRSVQSSTADMAGERSDATRVSSLEAELAGLRAEVERSRLILQSALDYGIVTMSLDGRITGWSPGAEHLLFYPESEVLGLSGEIMFTSEDRAGGDFALELRRALETGRATNERWHVRRDGTRFWASGMMMPLLNAQGQPQGYLNILRDHSDLRAETERRELLVAEMNHRIKNTLSIVQAVASMTSRRAATAAGFRAAFDSRLMALARSHDVLIRSEWEDAPLREVIDGALRAFDVEPGRIVVEGRPMLLASNFVIALSLALHELATNAVKHGALSTPDGRVDVTWTVDAAVPGTPEVELTWRERGGPPVAPPARRGFGSKLLSRGLLPAGTVRLDFQRGGLECRIALPSGTSLLG